MKRWMGLLFVELLTVCLAQGQGGAGTAVRVALVKMPYVGERNVPDTSRGPDYLEEGGIRKLLEQQGVGVKELQAEQPVCAHQGQDLCHFYRSEGDRDADE